MNSVEQLKNILHQNGLRTCRYETGRKGEEICKKWMESQNWEFDDLNDDFSLINSKLAAAYGKRPDFVVTFDNEIVLLDAKHHQTNGLTTFTLTVAELAKYINLEKYLECEFPGHTATVVFMLLPRESGGKTLTFFCIDDFNQGTVTTLKGDLAIQIDIRARLAANDLTMRI